MKPINQADWREALATGCICRCGHSARVHHHGKSCTVEDTKTFKFCKCERFSVISEIDTGKVFNSEEEKGETVMAAAKKGKKIVLFEVTDKDGKELLDKENTSNAALFYRVLAHNEKPMERLAIYSATESKCESKAAFERLGNQTHDTLARLRKSGHVKRLVERAEVEASEPKAKREKKASAPRKARQKASPTHSEHTQEQAASA